MDFLKDLPSRDKGNFSRFSQGSAKNQTVKSYIKLKSSDGEEERKAQVIVTDNQSLLLRELEREALRKKRISLKRACPQGGTSRDQKAPRPDRTEDSS